MKDYTNIEKVALFMGGKKDSPESEWVYFPELGKYHKLEDMFYESSWDWLIPVIDKITSLNEYSKFKDYTASMVSEGGIYINTKYIENTYSEVVNFIEWYNKQPK